MGLSPESMGKCLTGANTMRLNPFILTFTLLAVAAILPARLVWAQSVDLSAKAQMGLEPFAKSKFDATMKARQPVLVMVSASWCSVCRVQENVIRRLVAPDDAYAEATFLRVDFDSDKPAVKQFKADTQSTLIAFRNGKEIGRMVGSTDTGKIKNFAAQLVQ
jgi:thioredoxin 1